MGAEEGFNYLLGNVPGFLIFAAVVFMIWGIVFLIKGIYEWARDMYWTYAPWHAAWRAEVDRYNAELYKRARIVAEGEREEREATERE
jgi:hypothetical protein